MDYSVWEEGWHRCQKTDMKGFLYNLDSNYAHARLNVR